MRNAMRVVAAIERRWKSKHALSGNEKAQCANCEGHKLDMSMFQLLVFVWNAIAKALHLSQCGRKESISTSALSFGVLEFAQAWCNGL